MSQPSVTPIAHLAQRRRQTVRATVTAITYSHDRQRPQVSAQLDDGTGQLSAVWNGRKAVAGLKTGMTVEITGMVAAGPTWPIIRNPAYRFIVEDSQDAR